MKVKFNLDNYLKTYMENDIALVNSMKHSMNDSLFKILLVYAILNTIVLLSVSEIILFNIGIPIISGVLLTYLYLCSSQYKKNKTFKSLVKCYMLRGNVFIIEFFFSCIIAMIFFPNISDDKLFRPIVFIIGSIIGAIILMYFDNKYMKTESLKPIVLPSASLGIIGYLIFKKVGDQSSLITTILFVCFLMGLSGFTKNTIRSIRLLKYAPKDVLESKE